MNRKKLAGLALILCALLAPAGTIRAEEAPMEMPADYEPTEGAPLGSLAVNPSLRSLGLLKRIRHYVAESDGKIMFRQAWPELCLADGDGRSLLRASDFPQLAAALDAYNRSVDQRARRAREKGRKGALAEYGQRKESGYAHSFVGYSAKSDLIMQRADALVLSFLAEDWSYTGGVHGLTTFHGVNIDAATGTHLSLHDVFPDPERLISLIVEKLRAEYDPATFFDSMEDTVADGVLHDKVSWVLHPRGVTFWFNPYAIAPYASGILSVNILVDERPGLFGEAYRVGPASYCEELPLYYPAAVQLSDDGNGRESRLSVSLENGRAHIRLDGRETIDEGLVKSMVPVFVHTGEGNNYLYLDCEKAIGDGSREIHVYDLTGGIPTFVGISDFTFHLGRDRVEASEIVSGQWIMTDPYEFRIDAPWADKDDASAVHVVEIGPRGMPSFG